MKIAGVVILYHPTKEDINSIGSYISELDKLYVIDNTEDENNKNKLPRNKKIDYIFLGENVGVAKALNIAVERALKDNYEWLLTMDQDTIFPAKVLKEIKKIALSLENDKIGIITPWHKTKLKIKKPNKRIDYPLEVMTSGNLVNLKVNKKVGGYQDDLFIDGIDIEYGLKLNANDYKIMRINDLEILHNLGEIQYKKFLGKEFLCTNHNHIRRYYMMRNYHYIHDKYKNQFPEYCKILVKQKSNIVAVMLFEKNKIKKVKGYIRGYLDYRKGIKGKFKNK